MTKIEDFSKAATEANARCVRQGMYSLTHLVSDLLASLRNGGRAASRVQLFKDAQSALGLAIAADGRQSMVEDLRANAAQLKEEPTQLVQALAETLKDYGLDLGQLSKYNEDEDDSYTDDELAEDSDDPPSADVAVAKVPSAPTGWPRSPILDYKPVPHLTILPPEPAPEQKRDLESFFRGFKIV